jgi:hypothetical protein
MVAATCYDRDDKVVAVGFNFVQSLFLEPNQQAPFEVIIEDATQSSKVTHYSLWIESPEAILASTPTTSPSAPRQGCVIATAVYGTELAPEVTYIRHVRDDMIGSNEVGRMLVEGWNTFYYSWSPPVAECVASSESLQAIFRVSLLLFVAVVHSTACVYTAIASLNPSLASIIAFLFAGTTSTVIYAVMPLLLLQFIVKKRFKSFHAVLRSHTIR